MQKTAFQTKEVEYPPILYTCGIWLKKEERLLISTTTAIRKDAGAHETKAVMKQTDLYVSPEARNAAPYSGEEAL